MSPDEVSHNRMRDMYCLQLSFLSILFHIYVVLPISANKDVCNTKVLIIWGHICVVSKKSVVFLPGHALELISKQPGGDYNGKICCVTPAQYSGIYITWHPDNRLALTSCCAARNDVTGRRHAVYAILVCCSWQLSCTTRSNLADIHT